MNADTKVSVQKLPKNLAYFLEYLFVGDFEPLQHGVVVDVPMLLQTSSCQVISSGAQERKVDRENRFMRDCRWTGSQSLKQSSPDVVPYVAIPKSYLRAFKHPVHMYTRVRSRPMNYLKDVQQISQKPFLRIARDYYRASNS